MFTLHLTNVCVCIFWLLLLTKAFCALHYKILELQRAKPSLVLCVQRNIGFGLVEWKEKILLDLSSFGKIMFGGQR